jgi:hypothetical protein
MPGRAGYTNIGRYTITPHFFCSLCTCLQVCPASSALHPGAIRQATPLPRLSSPRLSQPATAHWRRCADVATRRRDVNMLWRHFEYVRRLKTSQQQVRRFSYLWLTSRLHSKVIVIFVTSWLRDVTWLLMTSDCACFPSSLAPAGICSVSCVQDQPDRPLSKQAHQTTLRNEKNTCIPSFGTHYHCDSIHFRFSELFC